MTTIQGLKTRESDKFNKFFAIVQEAAKEKGCVFFLDAGDGRDFETDTLEGEDLMGWLIPLEMVESFEKAWETDEVSDAWSDFFCWAVWNDPHAPKITFVCIESQTGEKE